jgi:hypothetical protein
MYRWFSRAIPGANQQIRFAQELQKVEKRKHVMTINRKQNKPVGKDQPANFLCTSPWLATQTCTLQGRERGNRLLHVMKKFLRSLSKLRPAGFLFFLFFISFGTCDASQGGWISFPKMSVHAKAISFSSSEEESWNKRKEAQWPRSAYVRNKAKGSRFTAYIVTSALHRPALKTG